MDEVVALEQNLLAGWSNSSVREEIDRPFGLQLVAHEDCGGAVIGWCCGFRVAEEAELLRIGVAPDERQCGVASALLARFEKECGGLGIFSVFLEVAETNMAARRLYEKFSYIRVGRRKGYYSQPVDDALVLNKRILS